MSEAKDRVSFTEAEIRFIKKLDKQRMITEAKFPLLTGLAATFGFVAVLYGFEKIIDSIPLLANNPVALLVTGLAVLAVTGTVFKKLN